MAERNRESLESISVEKFAMGTMFFFFLFVLVAIPQWMLLSMYLKKEHLLYTVGFFFGSFFVLICIHMSHTLKYKPPFNYIAIALCYELMTLGVGSFVMNTHLASTMLAVLVSLIICVVVILIGYWIIKFDYPNPFKFGALPQVGFTVVILIAVTSTMHYWSHTMDVAINILIVSVLFLILTHIFMAQYNIDYLIKGDMLMLGFVFYMNYVIVLIAIYIDIKRLQEMNHLLFWRRTTPNEK